MKRFLLGLVLIMGICNLKAGDAALALHEDAYMLGHDKGYLHGDIQAKSDDRLHVGAENRQSTAPRSFLNAMTREEVGSRTFANSDAEENFEDQYKRGLEDGYQAGYADVAGLDGAAF